MNAANSLTLICLLVAMAGLPGLRGATAAVGKTAPDFTLTDTYGIERSLSDYSGKAVVLEWINHGCPFVKKHYQSGNMQNLQKTYVDQGVVWLSICSSAVGKQGHMAPGEWNKKTEELGASPSAVLIDESGEVGRLYGARTTPHMFVIGPDGVLVYNGAIDSISTTQQRDIEKAIPYVALAIDAALAGEPVATPLSKPYGCSVKY
jgi:peroxiredoxin